MNNIYKSINTLLAYFQVLNVNY